MCLSRWSRFNVHSSDWARCAADFGPIATSAQRRVHAFTRTILLRLIITNICIILASLDLDQPWTLQITALTGSPSGPIATASAGGQMLKRSHRSSWSLSYPGIVDINASSCLSKCSTITTIPDARHTARVRRTRNIRIRCHRVYSRQPLWLLSPYNTCNRAPAIDGYGYSVCICESAVKELEGILYKA